MTQQAKKLFRQHLRQFLNGMTSDSIERESKSVIQQVLKLDAYKKASHICCYVPMKQEINTIPLIHDALRSGKRLFVPIISSDLNHIDMVGVEDEKDFETFVPNKWSILEPTIGSIPHRENGLLKI
jgi:5-formyltetrahydrofolate cyclo-ligase